jgi:dynein heavy chain
MEEGASLDPNTVGGEGLPDALPKPTSPEEVLTPKDSRPSSPGDGSNNDDSVGKVSLVQGQILLSGYEADMWSEGHEQHTINFIENPKQRVLLAFIDPRNGLVVTPNLPSFEIEELAYFVKNEESIVTAENFDFIVQCGTVKSTYIDSLLRLLKDHFGPTFFTNQSWPDGIRNNFSGQLHRTMAHLTDAQHRTVGHTVLYIPDEGPAMHSPDAAKNKELVQRLEGSVIHWTRQIKEVLNAQEAMEQADTSGPLEEIEFWSTRCEDLSGLTTQLDKPGVLRVCKILEKAKSSYLKQFNKLARLIQESHHNAENCLKFVSTLKEPCTELSKAEPKNIPGLLPRLIHTLRIIWLHSEHYKSRERITALLRKVSREIIKRCKAKISLDDVFGGYVERSQAVLKECIECCNSWKSTYDHLGKVYSKFSPDEMWVLDHISIFAQIDAFIQRCKDLMEVCEGQSHFGRRSEGKRLPVPPFAGVTGPSIAKSFEEIQATYDKHLAGLRAMRSGILDVKSPSWHDSYNRFRTGVKDLEVMMQNAIGSAFQTAVTVQEGVEILECFVHLNSREVIKRTIDHKTVELYHMFNDELNAVKKEFNKKFPSIPLTRSRYSGLAAWARCLKRRIDRPMKALEQAHFLHHVGMGEETQQQYLSLAQSLEEFIGKLFNDWVATVDKELWKHLELPLMSKSHRMGMLDLSFSKPLLKLLNEICYWERLRFEIPHYTHEVYAKRENLRSLRENVLLVVRDYNRIIQNLTLEERALFKERIRSLDKKVRPGLTKLTWAAQGNLDQFVHDCRTHAQKVTKVIEDYKSSNRNIGQHCREICEMLMVKLDERRVFEGDEFYLEQKLHRETMLVRVKAAYKEIVLKMHKSAEVFRGDAGDVQTHWIKYTEKMDHMVEEALRLNIKWSLQELSKAINGDGKTSPNPLFKVKVVLNDKQICFEPSIATVDLYVRGVREAMIECVQKFHRLPEVLDKKSLGKPAIHEVITQDEEIKKVQAAIVAGLEKSSTEMTEYLQLWMKHKFIWEPNKDAFFRRYGSEERPVSMFDADIQRYSEMANNVQKEDTLVNKDFVLLDCSPIKLSILAHCDEWQLRFYKLLLEMASKKLFAFTAFLEDKRSRLSASPETLDHLGDSLSLLEEMQVKVPELEQQLDPLHAQFVVLNKYDVTVPEDVMDCYINLPHVWSAFKSCLVDSDNMLKKHKEKFRSGLLQDADEFKRAVTEIVESFEAEGPFTSDVTQEQATKYIFGMKCKLSEMKEREDSIRRGLNIFKIEQPPSNSIQQMEKDLSYLEQVWEMNQEWECAWDTWKRGQFMQMDTDSMGLQAQGMLKKVVKLGREVKDKHWNVVDYLKQKIETFKRTMPLIQDLRNDAMRERHWTQLKEDLHKPFDETSEEFTLEKIIELGLDQHSEIVGEISAAASKELSIEQSLNEIASSWQNTVLDVSPYKDKGHFKLKPSDEIFQALDDNQVTLATMKASRYVKPFNDEVDKWERTLSQILEVIEMTIQVQRQWMYLENIFIGEDIRKQLPQESADFDEVNATWKKTMTQLHKDPNALRGTHQPGILERLNKMNTKLEEIQKSLDMYLEVKRQLFPRFYFLSNDDLLEILGQSRNPEAVQPHMKKCFDNIKSLDMSKMRDRWEGSHMNSSEGEKVEFTSSVHLEGAVESWLCDVERMMRFTLKNLLRACKIDLKKNLNKRDKWIKEWAGQLCITASQIQWTADCEKALDKGDKKALRSLKKKQVQMLESFSQAVRGKLTGMERAKIVALVTIEVHARDIIDKLFKMGCSSRNVFEWLSQLRFYWEEDDCTVKQTNTSFEYMYEYLGNSGRLVITPLTDRCYMTLTTALHLHRGGSPKGPAGTGKTETTKDLGKALGEYVIVVNCSEGLDYKSMGRMFSGLAQSGAWGCFDEFNRINIEVLSVVAQQILSILQALSQKAQRFIFEGRNIRLSKSVGIFITMNPGYAGRTELPDNLKSMFRPIAMVVPDSAMIAEIILVGEGMSQTRLLARKVNTLYSLAAKQLSKQDHYDFGLRALVSVLRYAGKKKRLQPETPDEEVLLLAMKDMNIAKLTADDLPLFNGIVSDLFPGVETPLLDYSQMKAAISKELALANLQCIDNTVMKIIQLYETKNSRHATMIVGQSGSGKTVTWQMLRNTLTRLKKENKDGIYEVVKDYPINPKSISLGELYGEFDLSTNEWSDGVLSSVMRQTCADEKSDHKWIVFDGPVDTLWIESMNSVMDDNKVLTLINGERISMPNQVTLLFETEDLSVASPATVSRSGMVYNDWKNLGWKPFVQSWLSKRPQKKSVEPLQKMFDRFVEKILEFRRINCRELVPTTHLNSVMSLCYLFEALGTPENGVNQDDLDNFHKMIEMWFLFSMIWSLCASVDEDGRKKLDTFIREMEAQFPPKDTVFEYHVDIKNKSWVHWEEKLKSAWRYPSNAPFYKIMVPTVDTLRYDFIVQNLVAIGRPVLLVGPVGTGKTSVAQGAVAKLDDTKYNILTINLSAQTTSNNVQEIIESKVEKRTKGVYVPVGGKKLLTFMDDLNMPAKDTFGSQPPLELVRQWVDYGFWYDRLKQTIKYIRDMFLMAAMGPPGGGRTVISRRLQSRFNLVNMTFPQESQIRRIFGTMINQKLQDFDEEVKPLGDMMTKATIEVYNFISTSMLPTPTKIHYLFNLRDISKVFQGLLRAHKDYHDTKNTMARLWVHECYRVFSDRLVGERDQETFGSLIGEKLGSLFDLSFNNLCSSKQLPLFGDFLKEGQTVYEDLVNFKELKTMMENSLDDYNNEPGVIAMNLVLFRDAIEHVCRVVRVIRQPRGNMLLVGIGGSGRQSLARLASYIIGFQVFQVEVTRHYRLQEFRDDLRKLYIKAGVENKPTVFLFNDTQVVDESFLEDINNILSSGEVPNLYSKAEDFEEVKNSLASAIKEAGVMETNESIFSFFIERVRNNLHIVLCMSPVGDPFRNRLRQYPAFVNCTTIDWFTEWPKDALLEVGEKYMEEVSFSEQENEGALRKSIASVFVTVHRSVAEMSERMLAEMKRHNYVTPTNYLELVSGYKVLLEDKRKEIGDIITKLRNGLEKIDDTRTKVQAMTVELEETRVKVAQFQKECEEYLVVIVQQKQDADEQAKSVTARSEKIAVEEAKCKEMADAAQHDLDEALPALEEAVKALEALNKTDMAEVRAYTSPPDLVDIVMQAVMILRGGEPSWAEAKRQLADTNFIKQLKEYDKDNMSDRVLKKIGVYVSKPEFKPDTVGRVSRAAKSLCMWVRAMEVYGRIFRVVEPKKKKLESAMSQLAEKQASLAEARAKLQEVEEKIRVLKEQYEEKLRHKEELQRQAELTELKLDRAAKLVSGLAGERERWMETAERLEVNVGFLPGDCLLASAFLSYAGPFLSQYRDDLVQETWLKQVRELEIPCSPNFSFATFLADPANVRDWNIKGLPSDAFSTENGVIVTKSSRWPLMVDPQGQAIKWIKNMEKHRNLKIIDLQQPDFLRTLENSVQFGTPVLLQNVQEELDPSLGPILNKSLIKHGNRVIIKLGDKEVDFNPEFKFYITTKLSNPHYTPEISTKTAIVNFAVKEQGLEAQLLGIVVRKERPDLEESKDKLVVNIAEGKKKLAELEDTILRLLNTAQGSLLDDEVLVNTLQTSKTTSEEVSEQLETSVQTEEKIDAAREGYRPSAQRASILFFVMTDMGRIDPMYQFSLDAYINLFSKSIEKSLKHPKLEERINFINTYHTLAVYRYICRGLFERHKLLFAFHMCAKILESANKINMDEYNFFLRGGVVLDRETQMDNPCKWMDDTLWDNITELDKLGSFMGIANSFDQYPREWHIWYTSAEPETSHLPGEWENSCNELQRMCVVRSLRPDRVPYVVTSYINNNLGHDFTDPPVLNMASVLEDSSCRVPLIFVLSPGVDPTQSLLQLADNSEMATRFHSLSLGQGQAPRARKMIEEGVKEGHWVFLANCHLSLSWMPELDKLVEEELQIKEPHKDFRLWLSSSPHPDFPISILQAGIKMTTEPPKGLKANMKRLYQLIPEATFPRVEYPYAEDKYKKLLFSLCFFHSLLIERRKFLQLGWNVIYGFNDSDFEVSEHLLSIYLDEYRDTPWDALKYLIAGVNYGGHVTDDFDRRVLLTYINEFYSDTTLETQYFKLSSLTHYYVPKDGPLSSYKDYIEQLPAMDRPEAFGQHPNADIASQIRETRTLLDTLVSLQPQRSVTAGESREDKVLNLAADVLKKVPDLIDYEATYKLVGDDMSPLNVVLLQEIQRYNALLKVISSSLIDLEKGIKGLVVMSADLEEVFTCIYNAQVPPLWSKVYSSLKPLGAWSRDLVARIDQLSKWAETGTPPVLFWMSGFTFPTGFLTAVLQTAARRNNVSVDSLSWEFHVSTLDDSNLIEPPKDGVWVKGLFLEGAGWDKKGSHLIEPEPMQLVCPMPTIHFKPVEGRKKSNKGMYTCPCYYYPNRAGSFVVPVDLKSGSAAANHWIKRGTALLLSLDN